MQFPANEIPGLGFELQRRFRASPERIFRAWTQPTALREWWCPPGWIAADIDIDLREGGAYRIAMQRSGSGSSVLVNGRFIEIRIPQRLVYTWRWEGAFAEMPETLVTLELQGTEDETLLTLRHEGFDQGGTKQQHRSGWISACDRLDRSLNAPPVPVERSLVG